MALETGPGRSEPKQGPPPSPRTSGQLARPHALWFPSSSNIKSRDELSGRLGREHSASRHSPDGSSPYSPLSGDFFTKEIIVSGPRLPHTLLEREARGSSKHSFGEVISSARDLQGPWSGEGPCMWGRTPAWAPHHPPPPCWGPAGSREISGFWQWGALRASVLHA